MWYWFWSQCLPFAVIHNLVKLEHYLLSSSFSSVQEQGFLKHDVTVSEVVPIWICFPEDYFSDLLI